MQNDFVLLEGYDQFSGSGTLSQTMAESTLTLDRTLSSAISLFAGAAFFQNYLPRYPTYTENGSGQYYSSGGGQKRASFADATARHQMLYNRYHKSRSMCSICHDVSNPALANLGLSGLPDQSSGQHLISEQYSASQYFHVERTFSEFMLSAYGQGPGAATNSEFQSQGASTITWAASCQDCHMMDVVGKGANKADAVLRPTGSSEHPQSGQPWHDQTGGNAWISRILASLDPNGPVYDPVNVQILNQGPSALTLDLSIGETPTTRGVELKAGSDRAKAQLLRAATLTNLGYNSQTGELSFRVLNNTGHKLISGFPEGRRMFLNIKVYYDVSLLQEINPYDVGVGTLKGLPLSYSPNSPPLEPHEVYIDPLVYEIHPTSSLTGETKTFHFVLATGRYKDNRIPPKGFLWQQAEARLSEPVWQGQSQATYYTSAEYAGGYDDVALTVAAGGSKVEIRLYYQGTSREYVEFLSDEINGVGLTLSSPAPSGEPQAYIIQTDPFFARLKAWGDAIWQLWYHNHGLDGGGQYIEAIVPYLMNTATLEVTPVPTPAESPTVAPTSTLLPTASPSLTPTATLTSTLTPTESPTLTPTESPTLTPTPTVTNTFTPTLTPTLEPTVTPSAQWSMTPTEVPTQVPTPVITATPVCIHDGDVNGDANNTAEDSQLAFYITLGVIQPTETQACSADCNNDGDVTAEDAQIIFYAAIGMGSCVDPLVD